MPRFAKIPRRFQSSHCRSAVAATLALAAAGGVGCGATPSGSVPSEALCSTIAVPAVFLAAPQPGATGIATTLANVVIIGPGSAGVPNPYGIAVTVTSASGTVVAAAASPTFAPSPLPSPIATISPVLAGVGSGDAYAAVPLAPLGANTTYTVTETYLANLVPPLPCGVSTPHTLGSFSTGG